MRLHHQHAPPVSAFAEPLACIDMARPDPRRIAKFQDAGFDVVGVRAERRVVGWARTERLASGGAVRDHLQPFEPGQLLASTSTVEDVVDGFAEHDRLFVLERRGVVGIVTRGDLHKLAFRTWAFGIVLAFEAVVLEALVEAGVGPGAPGLSPGVWAGAESRRRSALRHDEELALQSYLLFSQKLGLASHSPALRARFKLTDARTKAWNDLRNALAHPRPLAAGREAWLALFERLDELRRLARVRGRP